MARPDLNRVVIIGAGWYGLAAAGTYRQINPTADIIIIDQNSTIGGTWSEDRIYPTLIADSPCNGFEFSDLSMTESLGIPAWADIRGHDVYRYLQTWATKHDLMRLCKFNTKVVEVSRTNGLWTIRATRIDDLTEELILCEKLIVASGLSSKPNIPTMPTHFDGITLHSKQLGENLLAHVRDTCRQVIVVGGHKSAVEIVQICAFVGKKVTWLIREEGNGPSLLMNARLKGNHVFAQAWRRVGSLFKSGAYARRDFWYQFLQSGRCSFGFGLMQWAVRKQTIKLVGDRYSSSENGKRLKPQADSVLSNHAGVSFLHEDDERFMQIINDGKYINVVRGSIDSSSGYDVRLSNGTVVRCEVIVFATGWIPGSMSLFQESDRSIYGIPTRTDQLSDRTASYWKDMDSMGDVEIRNIYPWLPKDVAEDADTTQFRLFRTIVPPELAAKNDRSLIFLGHCGNAQTPMFAEVSALWGVAYLEGLLETGSCEGRLGDLDGMNEDVAIVNAYMRKRYRGKGKFSIPVAPAEIQTFVDRLVSDLGLRTDRKVKNSSNRGWFGIKAWIEEWFTPYLPVDYRGIIDEFLALKVEEKKKKMGGGIGSTCS